MTIRLGALCVLLSCSLAHADSTASILARMDKAAPQFQGATANLTMVETESLLNDSTTMSGNMQMQRTAKEVRAIVSFTGSDARTLFFKGKIVRIYYPKLKGYQDYDFGSDSQVLNQFLLLGFGSSGKELAASYTITDGGTETINGSAATKLVLIPKSAGVLKRLSKVEIWIAPEQANPIQQEFYEPSGNSRKVTYSNVKINPPMPQALEFVLPPQTRKIH